MTKREFYVENRQGFVRYKCPAKVALRYFTPPPRIKNARMLAIGNSGITVFASNNWVRRLARIVFSGARLRRVLDCV